MTRLPRDSASWAIRALRDHEMPPEEIRAVLAATDPDTVSMYLELHLERLDERVAEQRRTLASLERRLTAAILGRRGDPPPRHEDNPGAVLRSRC